MKKRILTVDDDMDIQHVMSIILTKRGFLVEADLTGESISLLQPPYPDLIILDIALHGYDGRDLCSGVKSLAATASIPVLFCSSQLDLHLICREYQADDYLCKPFTVPDLIFKVEHLMQKNITHSVTGDHTNRQHPHD